MTLRSQVESILFVAEKQLSARMIARALREKESAVADVLEELKTAYNREDSGIRILTIDDEMRMTTNAENASAVAAFCKEEAEGDLTKAELETLTVIAYRGPITRPELEEIRGVNCALILRHLLVRGLIEEKEDSSALSNVFSLSFDALRHLGITSPEELPEYEKLHPHETDEPVLASE